MTAAFQKVCSECPTMFAALSADAKTCSGKCRARRKRRLDSGDLREFAGGGDATHAAMEEATAAAVADLPEVAREVLAEELRPRLREKLSGRVLDSIGDMIDLLPLAQEALREGLTATKLVTDSEGQALTDGDGELLWVPDHQARDRSVALVLKYTAGQPGLAPQPDAPDQAPIIVNFPSLPAPTVVEAEAVDLPEVGEGERLCGVCLEAKPEDEFVGSSNRCYVCHGKNRARVELAIEERTGGSD